MIFEFAVGPARIGVSKASLEDSDLRITVGTCDRIDVAIAAEGAQGAVGVALVVAAAVGRRAVVTLLRAVDGAVSAAGAGGASDGGAETVTGAVADTIVTGLVRCDDAVPNGWTDDLVQVLSQSGDAR